MAYTKQGFAPGDILKAEHMNAIETGIEEAHNGLAAVNTALEDVNIETITQSIIASLPIYEGEADVE